ncbi:MAG: glutathione S-transferase family protein [Gammaproteobacteria bacterium]
MIKLHGAPLSNYYNMVKTALLEKGLEFEDVMTPPSQEDDYLAKSAMGKIPCIETEDGFLAESIPILEYLEETHPKPALLPSDPYARAKVRELAQSLELYIELVARRGFGALRGNVSPTTSRRGSGTTSLGGSAPSSALQNSHRGSREISSPTPISSAISRLRSASARHSSTRTSIC